jgi:hypothetical protein
VCTVVLASIERRIYCGMILTLVGAVGAAAPAASVTVIVLPATVNVPVRDDVVVFAAAV